MVKCFFALCVSVCLHQKQLCAQKVILNERVSNIRITGILGAFPPELMLLKSQMTQQKDTLIQQMRFTKGILRGRLIVLAQTGIGKVNAAITTTLMIEHFNPREIIFSGIAGGIDTTLFPGDIVIGMQITYHDYGLINDQGMHYEATQNPITMKNNPRDFICDSLLVSKAISTSKNIKLEPVKRNGLASMPTIKPGHIVTGDVFVASDSTTKRLRLDLGAAATEMEGAAIAQTCWQQHIPFLIIRSLSDNANSTAGNDVQTFYQIAARNAAILVMAIVEAIAK